MGRRGVGSHGTSMHGGAPGQRGPAERPYSGYSSGPPTQRGPLPQQESWETLSSSAQSSSAQTSSAQYPPTQSPAGQRSRQSPRKPGRGATYSVVVMTMASLFGVAVLAAQAAATAPQVSNTNQAGRSTARPTASTAAGSASGAAAPNALPADSGTGQRIVYAEAVKRVWLVSSGQTVARTFEVVPGTVTAPTGTFAVTNRLSAVTGTDGTPVQYVVLFDKAKVGGGSATAFGFDAVANVTGMPPAPTSRTGGVRMAQDDAQALWNFSTIGTKVVVLP